CRETCLRIVHRPEAQQLLLHLALVGGIRPVPETPEEIPERRQARIALQIQLDLVALLDLRHQLRVGLQIRDDQPELLSPLPVNLLGTREHVVQIKLDHADTPTESEPKFGTKLWSSPSEVCHAPKSVPAHWTCHSSREGSSSE